MAYNDAHNDELYQKLKQTEGYKIYYRESIVVHFAGIIISAFLLYACLFPNNKSNNVNNLVYTGIILFLLFFLCICAKALYNDIFKAKPVEIYVGEVIDIIIKDSLGKEVDKVYLEETAQLYYQIQTESGLFEGTSPKRNVVKSLRNPQNIVIGEICYGFITHNGERFVVK